jgi:hypothetical protein
MIGFYYGGPNASTKIFGSIASLDFDATLDELHDWKNEVTQNPVETGSPITDHIIEKSDKLRLQGVITNSPLRGEFAGQYFGGETASPRIQTTFEAIRTLKQSKEVIVVYTKHAIYTDMVIESVSIPRNAQIGEEVQFTMELVNIRFVSTQMVKLPPGISAKKAASTVGNKAEAQKSQGNQETKNLLKRYPEIKEDPKPASVLSSLTGRPRGGR